MTSKQINLIRSGRGLRTSIISVMLTVYLMLSPLAVQASHDNLKPHNVPPALSEDCAAADINLVVDYSSSVDDYEGSVTTPGTYEGELAKLIDTVEARLPGSNWTITSFRTKPPFGGPNEIDTDSSGWSGDTAEKK